MLFSVSHQPAVKAPGTLMADCQKLNKEAKEQTASVTLLAVRLENRHRFDFDQEFGAAEDSLNARRGGQRIQSLLLEKLRPNLVESFVVAFDIPQIAGGANDVFPRGALGLEEFGNVLVRPPGLGAEIADVDGSPVFVDAGGARDQQNRDPFDVQSQAAREGRRLGIIRCFI